MDLQTYLNNTVAAMRAKTLKESPQLTLGELILKLEPIVEKQKERKEPACVEFDFGTAIPAGFASWRGAYEELALGYQLTGYDVSEQPEEKKVTDFLDDLKAADGKVYGGWKGGEFKMHRHTPVWVANPGNAGNTGIVEVVDDGYRVILITAYCEY